MTRVAHDVVRQIAEYAEAIAFQAGVGSSETAGQIVSFLWERPSLMPAFMAGTLSAIDTGMLEPNNGVLSWHGQDGDIHRPDPSKARFPAPAPEALPDRTAYDAIGSGKARDEAETFVRNYLLERDDACGFLHHDDSDAGEERKESAREIAAAPSTPSPQIGKAGDGPVGEAVARAQLNIGYLYGIADSLRSTDPTSSDEIRQCAKVIVAGLLSRPVEGSSEMDRVTRERDEAFHLSEMRLDRAGRAIVALDAAEAALAETRERLEKREKALRKIAQEPSDDVMTYSLESCRSIACAALTGDAQEANR